MSNVRRPVTTAPVAITSSKIFPLGPGGSNPRGLPRQGPSHSCSRSPPAPRPWPGPSSGPVMNPSSDIDMYRTDLDMSSNVDTFGAGELRSGLHGAAGPSFAPSSPPPSGGIARGRPLSRELTPEKKQAKGMKRHGTQPGHHLRHHPA